VQNVSIHGAAWMRIDFETRQGTRLPCNAIVLPLEDVMDTRTGNLFTPEQVAAMAAGRGALNETARRRLDEDMKFFKLCDQEPTQKQVERGRIGRNEPCPCGSGRKFKRCCFNTVP